MNLRHSSTNNRKECEDFSNVIHSTFALMVLKLIIQFLLGIGVGVYGYLMPSYINLGVFQLATGKNHTTLHKVILLISFIEIPYCFLCMSGMEWLVTQGNVLFYLRWLIVVVLLLMGVLAWIDAGKKHSHTSKEAVKPMDSKQLRILLIYAIFNPFQLSAWAIWGAYFIEKTWFDWSWWPILVFSVGAAIGVFVILKVYAIAGQKLVLYFESNRKQIDYGVAMLLITLAVVQLVRNVV